MLTTLTLLACHRPPPTPTAVPVRPTTATSLRSPASFASIADPTARSRALFGEIARVLQHPRCANCHPSDDRPRQGMAMAVHEPPVWRGPEGHGEPAMHCSTCHGPENSTVSRVPGAPEWHLAPLEMGWIGRSPAAICAQIQDPDRNGGKSLEELHTHMAEDALVAWGWSPGADRPPAPGSQAELAALVQAWIDTGAACPEEPR
jgi:mono/diheme cytochrome c family protein